MLKIAGTTTAKPASVNVGTFDITKSERTASGKMVIEVIATKRRVDVVWRMLPDSEYQNILSAITANKPFFTLSYPDAGGTGTMTCYSGDIMASLWHTVGDVRYWDEVRAAFIEQ